MKTSRTISKSFIGFLGASFLIWVLITFSREYKTEIPFEVNFINVPQKNILLETAPKNISLYVKGSGFRLLWSQLFDKKINIDVSKFAQKAESVVYILPKNQLRSIQQQLISGVEIESILKDTMFVNMGFLFSKKVALKPNLNLNFQVGYNLLGDVKVTPDSIIISGDENQLKNINFLETESLQMKNINANFSNKVTILKPNKIQNIKLSASKTKIYAKVDKFTEGKLEISFKIQNVPSNVKLTTLSETVIVTFVVGLTNFSKVSTASFLIECDYQMSAKNELNYLIPTLMLQPDFVKNVKIIPSKIDFLIQK